MTKAEIFKRYLIFTIGLFVSSLGVAIVTKADLGTSPISSIPYVLSLRYPLTLGEFTIISVSYTHLDVYKRQHLNRVKDLSAKDGPASD